MCRFCGLLNQTSGLLKQPLPPLVFLPPTWMPSLPSVSTLLSSFLPSRIIFAITSRRWFSSNFYCFLLLFIAFHCFSSNFHRIFIDRKLNYHLYQALKKALYKPAAFFKGILLPLCEVISTPLYFIPRTNVPCERQLSSPRLLLRSLSPWPTLPLASWSSRNCRRWLKTN